MNRSELLEIHRENILFRYDIIKDLDHDIIFGVFLR